VDDLARLTAIHDIGQAIALYCNAMDDHDWSAMRMAFADDAVIGGLDGVADKGPDDFVRWLTSAIPESMKTVHHAHNLQVNFASESEAGFRCDFAAPTWLSGAGPFKFRDDHGSYLGRARKTAYGWRIAALTIQKTHSVVAKLAGESARLPCASAVNINRTPLPPAHLAAAEEIRQLKGRYCAAVDSKDWRGLRNVFADDCVLGPMRGVSFADADAFVAWISDSLAEGAVTVHHVHNLQIEFLSPTTARGRWRLEFWNWWDNQIVDGGHGYGDYWEYYRLVQDGWRISGFGGVQPPAARDQKDDRKRPLDNLQWLAAVEAIKTVKARYYAAVDDRDWQGLRGVFADDADFGDMGAPDGGGGVAGPDQFTARLAEARTADLVTAHHLHNFRVDFTSDTEATGYCDVLGYTWRVGPDRGPFASRMEWGSCRDRYRKTKDGWRLVSVGGTLKHATEEQDAGRPSPWITLGASS
jgi:ketosteroid isomerase-like protein